MMGTQLGNEARSLIRGYQARTGLSSGQLAHFMGIAFQTMVQFTTDNYPHDEDPLARRIIDWVEKNPPEIPPIEGRLYPTRNVALLNAQIEAAWRGEVSLIYGPPGTQKTYVFQHRLAEVFRQDGLQAPRLAYVYASAAMTARTLLQEIARSLVCYLPGTAYQLATNLVQALRRRHPRPALIIDEAQHLGRNHHGNDRQMLEVLRELVDRAQVGVVIAGHDDLEMIFDPQRSPLEQWVSRIDHRLRLPGLTETEVRQIATDELGSVNDAGLKAILKESEADDRRLRTKYYSARYLFKILAQVRAKRTKGNSKVH
jgi:type II secretory pathway predicted ATPase ExeA